MDSEAYYRRALAIYGKSGGTHQRDLATTLNNLAELYRTHQRYAEAQPLYERAVQVWEKAVGPEHPSLAMTLSNLALLHEVRKQHAAVPLLRRTLAIQERTLGPDAPDVARTLRRLATALRETGKVDEAARAEERIRALERGSKASDPPEALGQGR